MMARLHTYHPWVPVVCKSPPLSLCKHVFCISSVSTTGQNTCLHSGLFQKLQAPMTPSLLWMYGTVWELQNHHHHHHHLTERSGHLTLVVGKPANCHWFRLKLLPHPKSGFREWENCSSSTSFHHIWNFQIYPIPKSHSIAQLPQMSLADLILGSP